MPVELARADRYVKDLFDASPGHAGAFGFREKYGHTQRVVQWARRLLETERADADVVLMAAVFHDVGYTVSPEGHPARGADISETYLRENGYGAAFAAHIANCVRNHDDKSRLRDPGAPMELILLIEADCLDETGALSVLRDALLEGASGKGDYLRTYERLIRGAFSENPATFPAPQRPRAKYGPISNGCTLHS